MRLVDHTRSTKPLGHTGAPLARLTAGLGLEPRQFFDLFGNRPVNSGFKLCRGLQACDCSSPLYGPVTVNFLDHLLKLNGVLEAPEFTLNPPLGEGEGCPAPWRSREWLLEALPQSAMALYDPRTALACLGKH